VGHDSRNCPQLHKAKAPKINAGSIRFAEIDRLSKEKQSANVRLSGVRIEKDPKLDVEGKWELASENEIVEYIHSKCEESWGPDPQWYLGDEERDLSRFTVRPNGPKEFQFVHRERVPLIPVRITREDLNSPLFSMTRLQERAEMGFGVSSNIGGFPVIGEYKPLQYEAAGWLKMRMSTLLDELDSRDLDNGVKGWGRVLVHPTVDGYCVQFDKSDLFCGITHLEVLDPGFNPALYVRAALNNRGLKS
jgi:hypothetical protein